MKTTFIFMLVGFVCASIPIAAQTPPDGMVQITAGKFWMGRAYTIYVDSADLVARDRRDDRRLDSCRARAARSGDRTQVRRRLMSQHRLFAEQERHSQRENQLVPAQK